MVRTLHRIRARRTDERGFTLIELLVVVVIIGILVAIAIPVYLNYREGAADKSAQSDVRGAIVAVEQYYTENANKYPVALPTTAKKSAGTTLDYKNNTTSYIVCGVNSGGGTIYVYNSATGGSVGKSTQTTMPLCLSTGT